MEEKSYYVYILTNKNDSCFYIGVTNDVFRRVYEHKSKLNQGFSFKYKLKKLIYYEEFFDVEEAITREKQLKNWHRDWKLNLVRKTNPLFLDLAEGWYED